MYDLGLAPGRSIYTSWGLFMKAHLEALDHLGQEEAITFSQKPPVQRCKNFPASIWGGDIAGAVATRAQFKLSTGKLTALYCCETHSSKERWLNEVNWRHVLWSIRSKLMWHNEVVVSKGMACLCWGNWYPAFLDCLVMWKRVQIGFLHAFHHGSYLEI